MVDTGQPLNPSPVKQRLGACWGTIPMSPTSSSLKHGCPWVLLTGSGLTLSTNREEHPRRPSLLWVMVQQQMAKSCTYKVSPSGNPALPSTRHERTSSLAKEQSNLNTV
jgi:hypothetical protein